MSNPNTVTKSDLNNYFGDDFVKEEQPPVYSNKAASITENPLRIGNFTSSKIYKLMTLAKDGKSFGAPALTYIEEKNIERKMMRSLDKETYTQDMAWGTFLEKRVFELLGTEYVMTSDETVQHPTISFWCGSSDLVEAGVKVSEIKCYQPKNFALYTDALLSKDTEFIKKHFPQEYYQIVSNAIINQVPRGEAITYMPYVSEAKEIRDEAYNWKGTDEWKYRFIAEKDNSWLAFLPDNGYYKNLNQFEFEVPQSDKDFLTQRVELAGKLLIPHYKR